MRLNAGQGTATQAGALLLGLVLVIMVPGTVRAEDTYSELVGKAVAARKAGDLEGAANALKRAYKMHPSPEIHNNLGRVYEELGRYAEAYDIYLAVSNDPLADRSLRALDSGRMAALQPKIGVAWLLPTVTPQGATIIIDGRRLEGQGLKMEQATGPGRSGLELLAPDSKEVVVRVQKFPVGRRSTYHEDLASPSPADARLSFAGVVPVGEIRLNGYRLRTDLLSVPTVRVASGPLVLDVRRPGMQPEVHELDLGAGVTAEVVDMLHNEPLPQGAAEPWRPSKGPWLAGGTGGVAALVGAGFLVSASSSQGEIADATGPDGNVSGLSNLRAQELNQRANTHGNVGTALVSVGLTALVGGAVWYILDRMEGSRREADLTPTPVERIPAPNAPTSNPEPAAAPGR